MRRTRDVCRRIAIAYIKNNKNVTVDEIEKKLGINVHRIFGGVKNLFEKSGIEYNRDYELKFIENLENIIKEFKNNPLVTVDEIEKKYNFSFYKKFKSFKDFCEKYDLEYISNHEKRLLKKQIEIIDYIKAHPDATQWEINKNCKTHVQDLFNGGIREAFLKASMKYPESRRILYGTARLSIKRRALIFQTRIVNLLKQFGDVNTQIKTKHGTIDAILNYKNLILPVEIKDYRSKPISKTEIKQLLRYLTDLNCKMGLLISSEGRVKEFNLETKKIIIIPAKELENYLGLLSNLVGHDGYRLKAGSRFMEH